MSSILAKVISSPVKPYRGRLTRQDKKVIDEAILAWSNDTIGEAIDFEQQYGVSPKEFIDENMDKCLALYGNKKAVTLYRALHFPTRNKLIKFIDSLDSDVLVEKQIRSWTTDKAIAMRFFNRTGLVNHLFGCLLVQQIGSKQGLQLEVNPKFEFDEDEILLPPGKFKVELVDYTVTNEIKAPRSLKKWDSYVKQLNKRYK